MKIDHPFRGNEKVFQPSIFRCKLLVSGRVFQNSQNTTTTNGCLVFFFEFFCFFLSLDCGTKDFFSSECRFYLFRCRKSLRTQKKTQDPQIHICMADIYKYNACTTKINPNEYVLYILYNISCMDANKKITTFLSLQYSCWCHLQFILSGQFIATSAEVTPNGGLARESPQNGLKLG